MADRRVIVQGKKYIDNWIVEQFDIGQLGCGTSLVQHILIQNYNYNHYMWKRQIMIIVIISRWYYYLSDGRQKVEANRLRAFEFCSLLFIIAVASWQYLATTLLGSIWRIIQDKRQEEDKDRRIWNNRISLSLFFYIVRYIYIATALRPLVLSRP